MTCQGGLRAEELRFDEVDRIIRAAVEGGEIPGVALHVRAEGRVVHERAFGRRHIDEDAALCIDDVFPVASLTKPVVAVGILRLCEDGALRLDDPVAHCFPEFAEPKVLVSYDLEPEPSSRAPRGASSLSGIS